MKAAFRILFIVCSILYPFFIYFGQDRLPSPVLAGALFTIIIFRVIAIGWREPIAKWWLAIGIGIFILTYTSDSLGALLWYPAFINLVFLFIFGVSLYYPPTMIERFARMRNEDLPDYAIGYTRKVTQVWCVFFIINAIVAAWTAYFSTVKIWALYNGLIAYLLIGTLFVCEWIVRYFYRRRHT